MPVVDPRSLVAFRTLLGLTLALDLLARWRWSWAWYAPDGVLPPALWEQLYTEPWRWSLHLDASGAAVELSLAAGVLLAVLFGAGVAPSWMALGAWVIVRSLENRNPLLRYGGDQLVPLLLLVAAVQPWAGGGARTRRWTGALLYAQVVVLYLGAGVAKVVEPAWIDGTALDRAVHLDALTRPFGHWLAGQPWLTRLGTWWTLFAELVVPFGVVVPWWRVRLASLAILISLNLGIFASFDVGWFVVYASAACVGCLPGEVWDRLGWTAVDAEGPETRVRSAAAAVLLGFTLVTGVEAWTGKVHGFWPAPVWQAVRVGGLYQKWTVFDDVPQTTRWYVAKAQLVDGTWVDLLADGSAVDYAWTGERNALFRRDFRWRLLLANVEAQGNDELGRALGRVLAPWWHRVGGADVAQLVVWRMSAKPGATEAPGVRIIAEWPADDARDPPPATP
jgi:hypothetical protein